MVEQDARDEQLAAARRVPNQAQVQLPDQPADAPQYVRGASAPNGAVAQNNTAPTVSTPTNAAQPAPSTLQPIDSGVKTLQIKQTADTSAAGQPAAQPTDNATADPGAKPQVSISLPSEVPTLKPGERTKIAVTASNSAAFRSAVLGLRYDSSKFAVRSIEYGDIFGAGVANTTATPFLNEKGKTNVSFSLPEGTVAAGNGILAYVEIEALSEGRPQITFDKYVMNFLTAEGRNFAVSF